MVLILLCVTNVYCVSLDIYLLKRLRIKSSHQCQTIPYNINDLTQFLKAFQITVIMRLS